MPDGSIAIRLLSHPELDARVQSGLDAEAPTPRVPRPLTAAAVAASGEIAGGLLAATFWQCLHIQELWVAPSFRNRGLARGLLDAVETEAIGRGCSVAYANTYTHQAPGMYLKFGYVECGRVRGVGPGIDRITFSKVLSPMKRPA